MTRIFKVSGTFDVRESAVAKSLSSDVMAFQQNVHKLCSSVRGLTKRFFWITNMRDIGTKPTFCLSVYTIPAQPSKCYGLKSCRKMVVACVCKC